MLRMLVPGCLQHDLSRTGLQTTAREDILPTKENNIFTKNLLFGTM